MCAKLLVNSVTSVSLVCLLSMDAVTCVEFVLLGNVVEPYIADCVNEEVLAPSTVPETAEKIEDGWKASNRIQVTSISQGEGPGLKSFLLKRSKK